MRVFSCGNLGHIEKFCRVKKATPINMAITPKEYDVCQERAEINGFEYFVLPDTGSTLNLISEKIMNISGLKVNEKLKKTVEIHLLNGNVMKISEECNVTLKFRNITSNEDFYIFKEGIIDIIIGIDLCNCK